MANAVNIADEVAAMITAAQQSGELTGTFMVGRKILPRYLIKELATTKVSVVPKSVDIQSATRAASEFTYDIEIGVQKKVTDVESEIPGLVDFVDQISKYLRFKLLVTNQAMWVRASIAPIYSVEHLASDSIFTSVLTVSYKKLE
jgi:hypothetical protein